MFHESGSQLNSTVSRPCVVARMEDGPALLPWQIALRLVLGAPAADVDAAWAAFAGAARAEFGSRDGMIARRAEIVHFMRQELIRLAAVYQHHVVVPEPQPADVPIPASTLQADAAGKAGPEAGGSDASTNSGKSRTASVLRGVKFAAIGTAVGAAVLVPVVIACFPAVLAAAGFGTAGVVAGSVAAGWQATMGGYVASGSVFAAFQSMGALGAASVTAVAAGGAGGAATGMLVGGVAAAATGGVAASSSQHAPPLALTDAPVALAQPSPSASSSAVRPIDEVLEELWERALRAAFPQY